MTAEVSMQDMCRTCMKQFSKTKKKMDEKQSIHEIPTGCKNRISIVEMLQVVQPQINIEIEDENLPTLMCSDCIQKLLVSHEFVEMYQNVDKKFRNMLKEFGEISNCHYDFTEQEESLDFTDENEHNVETKYEFEIEAIDVECIDKDEENSNDWPEFDHEPLQELSEGGESKVPFFLNPYSDDSDNEWIPSESWQEEVSPKKQNLKYKIDDDSIISTSSKMPEKRRKEKGELLPEENDDGIISCHQCESVFDDVKLWQEHTRKHEFEPMPTKKYIKKSNKPEKNQTTQEFECEHCGKGFAKISYYKNHLRIHTGEEPYLCIECGKSFRNISSLNTHMLRHKGEKTFQCEHCPKKFVCSSGLYGHMMVHTKVKPYVCDICGSAFHMAYQLRKHNLYHNGIKNYQCEFCDMRFVTREKQRRHMRTHTGEKPYRCKYCERAFAQSNDCVKHLRQHLGDNVYQCELCPLRFPLARDLRVHFATHKDDDEETRARNLEARMEEERNLQIKLGSKQLE